MGDVLDLGDLVVVGEDDGVARLGEAPDLGVEAGDILELDRSGGRTGASGLNHGEGIHGVGSRVRDRSSAAAEWVSAPIEMNSTPVVATSRRFSNVMPPLASSVARPSTCATASRRRSGGMLS